MFSLITFAAIKSDDRALKEKSTTQQELKALYFKNKVRFGLFISSTLLDTIIGIASVTIGGIAMGTGFLHIGIASAFISGGAVYLVGIAGGVFMNLKINLFPLQGY